MVKVSVLFVVLNGLLLTTAFPQYGGQYGGDSSSSGGSGGQGDGSSGGGSSGGGSGSSGSGGSSSGGSSFSGGNGGSGSSFSGGNGGSGSSFSGGNSGSGSSFSGGNGGSGSSFSGDNGGSSSNSGGGGSSFSSSGSSSSSSSGGGDLSVQCKASPDSSGKIRYDCSGVNKDAITLKTEHFLWLESPASVSQNLDIEIPNYSIDEFIKAAYKASGAEGAKINVLLKKPDVTYNAEKAEGDVKVGQPNVSVNYQPVDKVSVHYPSQKQYSNGGGSVRGSRAAVPAPTQIASESRPKPESGFRYYFIRQ